jgi:hypothetical protein
MLQLVLQTATPTPTGVGAEGLAAYWPLVRRGVWFVAVVLVG